MKKNIVLGLSVVVAGLVFSGCGHLSQKPQPHSVSDMMKQDIKGDIVGWENYKDDSDKDKVPDFKDKCPDTPLNSPVDKDGCPLDTDGDGVKDYKDECPNTESGLKVDEVGCALDKDGDKVPDYKDKCPNTEVGLEVDTNGCALDNDEDGVADYKDNCLNTPKGAQVDKNGCSIDLDGDGVPAGIDKCPNTEEKVIVDKTGCGIDTDGDGVFDGLDQCADTSRGIPVDTKGCPLDSDFDGVPDYVDKCPMTPKGMSVNDEGCPFVAVLRFNFDVDSAKIEKKYYPQIKEIADKMKANPNMVIEVQGYTDNTGTYEHNQMLSLRRAISLRKILINRYGIEPERIKTVGYGPDRPIASNDTEEGREKNRRIVVLDITNRKD